MARVLVTSRDRGAFVHLAVIARQIVSDGHDVLFVLSQNAPGVANLESGVRTIRIHDGPFRSINDVPSVTWDRINAILHAFLPDVVVLGLADRSEIAVDELFLVASQGRIPTAVMQDFWGELKRVESAEPDAYLVLDAFAAAVSDAETDAEVHVVGSPKHAAYAALDRATIRSDFRRRLGVGPDDVIIGYFGQVLHHLPSYAALLREIADEAGAGGRTQHLFYRPHPRESDAEIAQTRASLAHSRNLLPEFLEPTIEPWLLASDVVLSCFSTCGYDMLHLNLLDTVPWASVVFLTHDAKIDAYWQSSASLSVLPLVAQGAALSTREAGLQTVLQQAFDGGIRLKLQAATHASILDPTTAPSLAADVILQLPRRRKPNCEQRFSHETRPSSIHRFRRR